MPRLIDANKLKDHYSWWEGGSQEMTLDRAKEIFDTIIDVQPTVDAEPVRHGKWVDAWRSAMDGTKYWYRECSECGYERDDDNIDKDTKYCPNCGAKMDESNDQLDERREDA